MVVGLAAAGYASAAAAALLLLRVLWGRRRYPEAVRAVDSFYDRWRRHIRTVQLRGGRSVTALVAGAADPRLTVLFLHGSCARMGQFAAQIDAISAIPFVRVVAYDAVGCGRSAVPSDPAALSPLELARDASEVLAQLGGGLPCVMVGHSFGTYVALRTAGRAPAGSVRGLVLIGAGGLLTARRDEVAAATKVFALPNWALWLIRPLLSRGFQRMALAAAAPDGLRRQEAEASARGPVHAFASFWRRFADIADEPVDYAKIAGDDRAPVVLVTGAEDKVTPPAGAARLCGGALPRAEAIVVDGASHQVMQERPEKVTAIIEARVSLVAGELTTR